MNNFFAHFLPLLALLLDHVIEVAVPILIFMGRGLIKRAADWLEMDADSQARAYLQDALEHALEYGVAEARKRVAAMVPGYELENLNLAARGFARDYAIRQTSGALKRLGIDEAGLERMLRARLPDSAPSGLAG